MAFTLPDLPFAKDALAPHMSSETIDFHHGKHHKAYVDKTNTLLGDTDLEGASLVEVIRVRTSGKTGSCSITPRKSGTTASSGSVSRRRARPGRRASYAI